MEVVPTPSRRYVKKHALNFVHCPDCESKDITYYGKSGAGTQKYHCKSCQYQFVAQYDAVFPRSGRRELFEAEFLSNIKSTGFTKGCGKRLYWHGARVEVLQELESDGIRIRFNKILKTMPLYGEQDYKLLLEFILHEAYVRAT